MFGVRWVIFANNIVPGISKLSSSVEVPERQIISNLWTQIKADNKETFCATAMISYLNSNDKC